MDQVESFRSQIDYDQIKMGKKLTGSFWTVYEANVTLKAAVRRIDTHDHRIYGREINKLLKLQHENIVKIYGVCKDGNRESIYLVMELAENGSLNNALYKSSTPPDSYQVVDWGRQCASGVAYLHDQKTIHRDLKPHNCFLFNNERLLKICDFGWERNVTDETMTQGVGTLYMAPEVIEGKHYTEKCDIYSWGLMYWEMFAHKRPFEGKAIEFIKAAKKHGEPPALFVKGDGSDWKFLKLWNINAVLKRCWAINPKDRPTMNEVTVWTGLISPDSVMGQ